MAEFFDIYDEAGNRLGIAPRSEQFSLNFVIGYCNHILGCGMYRLLGKCYAFALMEFY